MGTKKILNKDVSNVVEESLAGYLMAYRKYYKKVGEYNAFTYKGHRKDKVALVIGGGSGHEPLFTGYCGAGLADAVACGNVCASPNPELIMEAAKAVDQGKGVLFVYGNYAGDNLNFDMAEEMCQAEGMKTAHVREWDDFASAPKERITDRRGIAGDVYTIKIAGAACDAGLSLEEVVRITEKARDNTNTIGLATSPGTLPGNDKPTFEIADDEMEFGMGLHGEPGIERTKMMPCSDMVDRMYKELKEEMGLKEGEILGVGITVEGLTDSEGERVTCSFTEQMSDVRREELAKYIPVETRLFHDMTAAGYNQKLKLGQNVFYLSLNSSIGGTVLVQDEVYNGNHNRAGEIGHMRLEKNGRRCYCGNYGCFDAYCNTLILKDAAGGELKDFFAGIDQGNRGYERILDEYVERLSDAVFNIRMLYDDTVLIGGELGEYADYFIEKVWGILDSQDIYREESAKDYVKVCEDGENVIAIGAAMYYINQAAVRL